jgi:hypothetical protein
MYDNKSEKGGRPNCDVILMFKILILQQWYGLSDLEVERQIADRISFMSFLGFPNPFPDSRTIWLFRERMAKTGKDEVVWAELQKQLDAMGLKVSLTWSVRVSMESRHQAWNDTGCHIYLFLSQYPDACIGDKVHTCST